ncbi:hypothetical protein MMC26_002161 [Xylographa opegraphella]|nr:hypothetical protein [Xylographa opegraphella]
MSTYQCDPCQTEKLKKSCAENREKKEREKREREKREREKRESEKREREKREREKEQEEQRRRDLMDMDAATLSLKSGVMTPNTIAGSSSSVADTSPDKSYRPASSVYEVVRPLSTKFKSELDAVHTRIRTIPPPKDIDQDRIASPCSERLAGEYRAELISPLRDGIEHNRHPRYSKEKSSRTEPERLYGLAPAVFWIVILLMVSLVAAGVAVGLALGLSRVTASDDVRCPTSTVATVFVNADSSLNPQTEPAHLNTASPPPTYTDFS